jgi:hypothetical protein
MIAAQLSRCWYKRLSTYAEGDVEGKKEEERELRRGHRCR